ncbi:SMP-30/gluconolactonase/LRE family protein [Wenzhouxiangella sp. EGI_FJ10409]|uniref:SMP-30/gluconolactonase/LRE family protein n=1 Tax=Wenzhouxiangella sp. EGI_FJ10409 TaxID=3243767 RepID=UPI0035D98736
MRKSILLLSIPVLLVLAYAVYLAFDAGEFRSVDNLHPGQCSRIAGVPGAEDITLHPDRDLALVSSFDRRAALAGNVQPGGIYAWALDGSMAEPANLTPDAGTDFRPHGISLFVGADGRATLFVVNHPGASLFGEQPDEPSGPSHTIEVFDLDGLRLVHRETLADESMISPNDIVAVDNQRFYFTNDHGSDPGWKRTLEDYLRLGWANVVYFDGEAYREVADGLSYANGINLSPDGTRLYVAEVTRSRIREYSRDGQDGGLAELRRFDVGFGVDNIEVDPDTGDLLLGGHVKLLTFTRHARDATVLAPSQAVRVRLGQTPQIETLFLDDGELISGASVATARDELLLVGSVFKPHMVVCEDSPD